MDAIKIAFGFLLFHRKFFIGILLIAAVAYWIVNGKKLISGGRAGAQHSARENVPDKSSSIVDRKSDSDTPSTTSTPSQTKENQPIGLKGLISSTDADQIITELVRLNSQWKNQSHSVAYVILETQKKLAQRLLEMKLTDDQQAFATVSYIEAISAIDWVNTEGRLSLEGTTETLKQALPLFVDSPSEAISSSAHLAMIVSPAYKFIDFPTPETLNEFETAFSEHATKAMMVKGNSMQLAKLIAVASHSVGMPDEGFQFAESTLEIFQRDESDEGKTISAYLFEQIYFGDLNLRSILQNIEPTALSTNSEVTELFDRLEKYPQAPKELYQLGILAIQRFIDIEDLEIATELKQRLESKVIPEIEDSEKKQQIIKFLDQIKF